MDPDELYRRYQELQGYLGWADDDAQRVLAAGIILEPCLPTLVTDFYEEIERHHATRKVITGGAAQIERLKGTLAQWLRELLSGHYDRDYVVRRWRVGWRHVEIGLDQVYTNVALSRLRGGLLRELHARWTGDRDALLATGRALNKLLDLDLAIIEDAYQAEYASRLQRTERLATIGQQQRLRMAKERSEAAFGALVEAAPCMIIILRSDHQIVYFNRFAEELTGYAVGDVLGKDYFALFLPEEARAGVAARVAEAFAGRPVRGHENSVLCKDGTVRWVIWNAQRLADYEEAPALLAVGQDITTLKQAQEQALQAERLAAIGQMMTGLAHESGNALARSQACLEMLALEVPDKPEVQELIERIQQAQRHLTQLYEEVRGYAAPLKLERDTWDMSLIWRQAWENLALRRQGKETSLHEHTAGVDLSCYVDPFRLEQVFRNLFENSLAACPSPVRIDITCTQTLLQRRPALRIAVRDNGPGLNAEQRRRIFEPFFTTKTKGTGLGMAIARRILDAHGGQIAVGTETGPGAEIVLVLPRDNS
jgi:PAS domain S-box-containing protein